MAKIGRKTLEFHEFVILFLFLQLQLIFIIKEE